MADPTSELGYVTSTSALGWSQFGGDLDENPALLFPESVAVYSRMRREETQVQSVLKAVKLPIQRTAWRLDANGADPEVVTFISENLGLPVAGQEPPLARRQKRFSWNEHLRLALTSLDYGFAMFEQVYQYGDDGRLWLRKLGWRPQATIQKINVDRDGGLTSIEQSLLDSASAQIPVDRLVAYVPEREGAAWTGTSLLRPSYKYWLLKDRLLRVQATTVERNGMGVPIYTAPDLTLLGLDQDQLSRRESEEIKRGLDIAKAFRSGDTAGAAIPFGAKLELLGVTGTLPDADVPVRYYDEQMARSALAHFLNLGTQTGSWALGTTFADFFTLSLQTVAEQIADVATQHIVEDLVDLNFGDTVQSPRVVFEEIGSQAPATAEALQSLVQTKVIRPDEKLETFMRHRYGLPAADPETSREDSAGARELGAAEIAQKVYLAVEKGLLSKEEGRVLIAAAGADIDPAQLPEQAPAPAPAEGGDGP